MRRGSLLAAGLVAALLVTALGGALPAGAGQGKKGHKKAQKQQRRQNRPTVVTTTVVTTTVVAAPPSPVLTIEPASSFQNGIDGNTGTTVVGRGFVPASHVTLRVSSFFTSPCNGSAAFVTFSGTQLVSALPLTVAVDSRGGFNALLLRTGCRSGTYEVTASTPDAPPLARAGFTVSAPEPMPTGFSIAPGSMRRTDAGVIAATLRITGLYGNEVIEIDSPDLVRCRSARVLQQNRGPFSLPVRVSTDFGGNNILGVVAEGCPTGRYTIDVSEVAAAARTFSATLEVT